MFHKLSSRTPLPLDYDQYRRYAVLAPFLPSSQEFLFEIRSSRLRRQPGEICFPGGHIENGETPLEAGIRETMEELLVAQENIKVIAPLDTMISPFNIIVNPYLAELHDYHFTYNPSEVASLFTVPFAFFLNQEPEIYYNHVSSTPENPEAMYEILGMESYPWNEGRYPVLFYRFEDKLIWGMTARFMYNIVTLYRDC